MHPFKKACIFLFTVFLFLLLSRSQILFRNVARDEEKVAVNRVNIKSNSLANVSKTPVVAVNSYSSQLKSSVEKSPSSFSLPKEAVWSFGNHVPKFSSKESSVSHFQLLGHSLRFATSLVARTDLKIQLEERRQDASFLLRRLQPSPGRGDVILDIGGNVGTYSVMLSKLYPLARILTFELLPQNFAYLIHNLAINSCSNVVAVNRGITKTGANVSAYYMPTWPGASGLFIRSDVFSVSIQQTLSFQQVLDLFSISQIKLLKIDCEGCEFEVIPKIPTSVVSFVCGEIHPAAAGNISKSNFRQVVKRLCDSAHTGNVNLACVQGCLRRDKDWFQKLNSSIWLNEWLNLLPSRDSVKKWFPPRQLAFLEQ